MECSILLMGNTVKWQGGDIYLQKIHVWVWDVKGGFLLRHHHFWIPESFPLWCNGRSEAIINVTDKLASRWSW